MCDVQVRSRLVLLVKNQSVWLASFKIAARRMKLHEPKQCVVTIIIIFVVHTTS